ncbi:unnamed protein product [Rotaria sordida]|uniref:VWFA domain-containing protein n=1 Tax=Rotaria sordida TaxID=392033 RepID=A0A815ZHT8_9BILA|nr:unnamed protein product [Rotaria sordida]CAF1583422.1 unnamed protein product [Rotaria sordida]
MVKVKGKCDAIIDLILIIDSSGSISFDDFQKGKEVLIDAISRLNIDVKKAGVALINYASNVSLFTQIGVFEFDKTELLTHIAALSHIRTNTATGDTLALARNNKGRLVIPAAQPIRNTSIECNRFAISIGRFINFEARQN